MNDLIDALLGLYIETQSDWPKVRNDDLGEIEPVVQFITSILGVYANVVPDELVRLSPGLRGCLRRSPGAIRNRIARSDYYKATKGFRKGLG